MGLVLGVDQARENITRYAGALAKGDDGLQEIMAYARGWYAVRIEDGKWALGPSKFVGYAGNDADAYLRSHNQRDGRLTERVLAKWFVEVPPGAAVYEELLSVLREMFARAGKTPNKLVRFHVLQTDLSTSVATGAEVSSPDTRLLERITVDPRVLGGRPCIRGMRISVRDVLDMLAAGAYSEQILADYPYLEPEDIVACLRYAARSVDHRVVRAA